MISEKDNIKTLYLDSDDEITAAIEKVIRASAAAINLVIPRGAVVLRSIINLRLLKKAVERHNIKVVIVTKDDTGLSLARKAGFFGKKGLNDRSLKPQKLREDIDEELTINEHNDKLANQSSINDSVEGGAEKQTKPGLRAVVEAERASRMRAVQARKIESVKDNSSPVGPILIKPVRTLPHKRSPMTQAQADKGHPAVDDHANIPLTMNSKTGGSKKMLKRTVRLLPRWPWKIIGAILGGLMVLAFLIMTFGFAKATVTVKLKKDTVSMESEIIAKPKPDTSKNEVTGRLIKAEQEATKTITPSGHKDVGQKATGSVTISNAYSDQPLNLSGGTDLVASGGYIFHLVSTISVPGAGVVKGKTVPGVITTGIIADKIGEEYNVGPTSFSISGISAEQQAKISASSDLAASGGTKKTVTILTADDLEKAKKELEKKLKSELDKKISDQVNSDEELLTEAKQEKSGSIESDVLVGAEAKDVHVKMKMRAQALVDKPEEVKQKALELLSDTLKDNQELLSQSKGDVSWNFKKIDFQQSSLVLGISVKKEAIYSLDEQKIIADIAGNPKKKAQEKLEQNQEIEQIKIELVPIWRKSLPHNYGKIRIKYD